VFEAKLTLQKALPINRQGLKQNQAQQAQRSFGMTFNVGDTQRALLANRIGLEADKIATYLIIPVFSTRIVK